ncbi:tRNA(Ile)-lysidine synthase [Novipirellula galeiformis]|uniref:tRNA(Ile)-lysidine synthase n=1 Tax=Novipirellula galeiformis TaxID=2528004 RepID=A0A5C6C9X9_9BACT|nr:tRNA lysidine(34) synthetase TilS [Novipirellula galeiformis]TWU21523.1 tRNA(Ile)-lysidine synthase [Novipirellula galeiformis]
MERKPNSDAWGAFCRSIDAAWPLSRWGRVGVVVGCSGGPDSVALIRGLHDLVQRSEVALPPGLLAVAHFNHATRGEESQRDESFVAELAGQLDVPFLRQRSTRVGVRDEQSLRRMRLDFLRASAEQMGARYVAVAHSADDNVETVLHHLLRGTGPTGLAGIRPHRPLGQDVVLVRPLLGITRKRICAALRWIEQSWCEDSSNANRDYRRNWIRHELMPMIESKYPDARDAISRASGTQRDWVTNMESQAEEWSTRHVQFGDAISIQRDHETDRSVIIAGMQQLWAEQRWPMQSMSQTHWQRIYDQIAGIETDACMLPGAIRIESPPGHVSLRRIEAEEQ